MKAPAPFRRFTIALALACALFLGACAGPAATPAKPVDPALVDPAKNSAVRPEPRDAKWVKRHEGFVAEAKKGGIEVLFMGDSITDFWRDTSPKRGRQVWDREFAPLHAANFGISGDRTQHVLWRLQNGEVDGISPKVVVLMISTNNTGFEPDKVTPRNTPEQAVEGVKAILHELRTRLPQTKILLLAVFPRGELPTNPQRLQVNQINTSISQLADRKHVFYLDFTAKFLAADGKLPKEIMPDFLHPNQQGYEIWAAAMKPTLLELLQK